MKRIMLILMVLMALSATGCVLNPHAGETLVADRTVHLLLCDIKPGVSITLASMTPVQGGNSQYDDVWEVMSPCGDVKIAHSTLVSSFSRPSEP